MGSSSWSEWEHIGENDGLSEPGGWNQIPFYSHLQNKFFL